MDEFEEQDPGLDQSDSEAPSPVYGGTALLLQYSYLRSSWIVARALAETFPDEASWLEALSDPTLQEALGSFSQLMEEMQTDVGLEPTIDNLLLFSQQNYGRALECIEAFAARIGVTPQDLLLVSLTNL